MATAEYCRTVEVVDGEHWLTLRNGIVSVAMKKRAGKACGRLDDVRLLTHSLNKSNLVAGGGGGYADFNTSTEVGGKTIHTPITQEFVGHRIVRQAEDLVEVSFAVAAVNGFSADLHYVLRRGEQGWHTFVILRKEDGASYDSQLAECRTVLRLDPGIFTHAAVPNEALADPSMAPPRVQPFPSPSLLNKDNQVIDATFRLMSKGTAEDTMEGPSDFYTKYEWCVSACHDTVHGTFGAVPGSDGFIGVFAIAGSFEWLGGGPMHPELTVHQTNTTPVVLKKFAGSHHGHPIPPAPPGWAKLHGPFFTHINVAATEAELWNDATLVATDLIQNWPPAWMCHALWAPACVRGAVRGTVVPAALPDGSLRGWAVLAAPACKDTPPLRKQALHFIHWGSVQENGSFTILHAREGVYSLWFHLPGCVPTEQLVLEKVHVGAGDVADVGEVVALNRRRGDTLWQIGDADGSVRQFRHGVAAELHKWALWLNYKQDFPNGVDFIVGSSDPALDWNLLQPILGHAQGAPEEAVWRVQFERPPGRWAVLTVAIINTFHIRGRVSAPQLDVLINGMRMSGLAADAFFGNSVLRGATRMGNQDPIELIIDLPSELLAELPHKNVLELRLSVKTVKEVDYLIPGAGVLYDFIRMEGEPVIQDGQSPS